MYMVFRDIFIHLHAGVKKSLNLSFRTVPFGLVTCTSINFLKRAVYSSVDTWHVTDT